MDIKYFRQLPKDARLRSCKELTLHEFVNFCTICGMDDLLSSELGKSHIKSITWVDRPMCNFLLNRYPEISYENMVPALKYYSKRLEKLENPPSEPLTGHLNVLVYEPVNGAAARCSLAGQMMAEFTLELTKLTDELNAESKCRTFNTTADIIVTIPKLGGPFEMVEPVRSLRIAKVTRRIPAMDVVVYCVDECLANVEHLECVIGSLSCNQYFILAIFYDIGTSSSLRILGEFNRRLRSLKNKLYAHTKNWTLWCVKCNNFTQTILNFGEFKNFLLHHEA